MSFEKQPEIVNNRLNNSDNEIINSKDENISINLETGNISSCLTNAGDLITEHLEEKSSENKEMPEDHYCKLLHTNDISTNTVTNLNLTSSQMIDSSKEKLIKDSANNSAVSTSNICSIDSNQYPNTQSQKVDDFICNTIEEAVSQFSVPNGNNSQQVSVVEDNKSNLKVIIDSLSDNTSIKNDCEVNNCKLYQDTDSLRDITKIENNSKLNDCKADLNEDSLSDTNTTKNTNTGSINEMNTASTNQNHSKQTDTDTNLTVSDNTHNNVAQLENKEEIIDISSIIPIVNPTPVSEKYMHLGTIDTDISQTLPSINSSSEATCANFQQDINAQILLPTASATSPVDGVNNSTNLGYLKPPSNNSLLRNDIEIPYDSRDCDMEIDKSIESVDVSKLKLTLFPISKSVANNPSQSLLENIIICDTKTVGKRPTAKLDTTANSKLSDIYTTDDLAAQSSHDTDTSSASSNLYAVACSAESVLPDAGQNRVIECNVNKDNADEDLSCIYHVKWISFNGRKLPIVTQNENGPCPLLAISNLLLLRGNITLATDTTFVESSRLLGLLTDYIFDCTPRNISADNRLNYEQNMNDAIAIFPKLQTGLDVNVRFTGVSHFEFTTECIVFDLLNIPLFHTWIVDPTDTVAAVIGTSTYNQLVEKIICQKNSEDEDVCREALLAEEFLYHTSSQMTYHGLCELNSTLKCEDLVVLFRNNHFLTLYKHKDAMYVLATDHGFLNESEIVWETLGNIEGDSYFVNGDLKPFNASQPVGSDANQIDRDYLVALSLQEEASGDFEQIPWDETTLLSDHDLALKLQLEEEKKESEDQDPQPSDRGLSADPTQNIAPSSLRSQPQLHVSSSATDVQRSIPVSQSRRSVAAKEKKESNCLLM